MFRSIALLTLLLVSFASELPAEDPKAGVSVCNNTESEKLFIAIIAARETDWIAEAWWDADRGECKYVNARDNAANMFLYLQDLEGNVWEGDYSVCIDMSKGFDIPLSNGELGDAFLEKPNCSDGQVAKGFFRVPTTPNGYDKISIDFEPGLYLDHETSLELMFQ